MPTPTLPAARKPPLVEGLPLLGNTLAFNRDPAALFVDAWRRHGPLFRVRILTEEYVVLAGEEAQDFLGTHGEKHLTRAEFFAGYAKALGVGQFALGAPPEAMAGLRKALRLGFSRQVASAYVPQMGRAASQRASEASSDPVALTDLTARVLLDQYGLVVAGRPLSTPLHRALRFATTSMNVGAKASPPLALSMPGYTSARDTIVRELQELLREFRDPARRTNDSPTVIDTLLAARDETKQPYPDDAVLACLLHGFVGSLVYTGRALAFLVYELLRDAALLERVVAEADAAWEGDTPDVGTLRRLPLLRAAFAESLRLHPIALGMPFDVTEAFDFDGHRIEPGTRVLFTALPGHFSERYYKRPARFEPDRNLAPRNEHKAKHAAAPYGFGTRTCSAVGFVETAVLVTVATWLREGVWTLVRPDRPLRVKPRPLPTPTRALKVQRTGTRTRSTKPAAEVLGAEQLAAFAAVPDASRMQGVMSRVEKRVAPPGTVIVRQGEAAEHFFIVTEGAVEVVQGAGADTTVLAELGPGQFFGEIGLLRGVPRTATVRALASGAGLLVLGRADFMELVSDADLVSDEIAQVVRRRFIAARLAEAIPNVDPARVRGVMEDLALVKFGPGELVIRQGEPAEAFYVVTRGELEVSNERPDGGRTVLATLRSGQFFGEIGLLQRSPRTATVTAASEGGAEVMVIDRPAFERLVQDNPAALNDIVMTMCQRLVQALERR